MMATFRIKDLTEQAEKAIKRAEVAEAKVAELEGHCEGWKSKLEQHERGMPYLWKLNLTPKDVPSVFHRRLAIEVRARISERDKAWRRLAEFRKGFNVQRTRVAVLDKVHAAAIEHLVANGPCDNRDEADDHEGGNCSESDCTYCALDRVASAVDEAPDQSGEGG